MSVSAGTSRGADLHLMLISPVPGTPSAQGIHSCQVVALTGLRIDFWVVRTCQSFYVWSTDVHTVLKQMRGLCVWH